VTTLSPTQRLVGNRPGVFNASVVRGITDPDGSLAIFRSENGQFVETTAIGETGSFRYDPIGSGIKSTQQLNVDWSMYENHVFFNSAQVKVNTTFNKIIDRYPFDGTRKELELFYDGMTGYENYVYNLLPKNNGYLFFSGSNIGDVNGKGTFVTVKDRAGAAYPFLTDEPTGVSRLDPVSSSVTIQSYINFPDGIINQDTHIFQKIKSGNGFGCFAKTGGTQYVDLTFYVVSGSSAMSASATIQKGIWNPVSFVWNRDSSINQLSVYVSGTLAATSKQLKFNNLNIAYTDFTIGTGSALTLPPFTPQTTFSGALDEFRYYKRGLTQQEIIGNQTTTIYPDADLTLYFRFNEPSGSSSPIVLDYSGKGMHGTLNGYGLNTLKVRNIATSSLSFGPTPMVGEDIRNCPILFPDHPGVIDLRTSLSTDAANYDADNPNHILKLVPKHYLLYGQLQSGLTSEEGDIDQLNYGAEPNTAQLGNTQTLVSLLYMWASFFDEIKLFLDAFSTLRHVDYNQFDTVPDAFLKQLSDFYGLQLPPLLIGANIEQFINGKNITADVLNSANTLQYIQNQIWRRILINANDILKSKGTLHSIKSFLRAVGIEGDNIFRFREYGGPTQQTLNDLRESRNDTANLLNFQNGGYVKSAYLSASRIEPGIPYPAGTFITDPITGRNAGTTVVGDAFLTSGSWTCEGMYDFGGAVTSSISQSLMRVVGYDAMNMKDNIFANLVASGSSGLSLYVNPMIGTDPLILTITGSNVMDGQTWNVSFGRTRGDLIGQVSSSYFLRVGRNHFGKIIEEYVTSSLYDDHVATNYFETWDLAINAYGPYLAFGSGSTSLSNTNFLNVNSNLQTFNGKVAQVRFWSKDLTLKEWREHVRDYHSLGVEDPRLNFNFESTRSGSFQKLRMDMSLTQPETITNGTGQITLTDFSQNGFVGNGTLFPVTSSVFTPKMFHYSYISPLLDEAATNEKVRIRSFQDMSSIESQETTYAYQAPVYEILQDQIPEDNAKFSIDFNIVDSLNQDIINMFSALDLFNNALGAPNLMFSSDYPDLEVLRNIYFNRLTSDINVRGYFDFFKWFNTNIGKFIQQLLPRKVKFKGVNYVIESHMLERPKIEYHFEDYLIGPQNRSRQKEQLYVQIVDSLLRKY
jgi:hypothetical protein